jgi:hypothetical protein
MGQGEPLHVFDLAMITHTSIRYGQKYAPSLGAGYVSELLARLTSNTSFLQPNTQINITLDSDPSTFPLKTAKGKEVSLFVDFSHDDNMISIYTALGLYPHSKAHPLNDTEMGSDREYVAGTIIPFAGRMVVEKMDCFVGFDSAGGGYGHPLRGPAKKQTKEFVRILVNDDVQPLASCSMSVADSDLQEYLELGICLLDKFVESQEYVTSGRARKEWEKCHLQK